MDLFVTLLLGHLIADFPLQMNWLFRLKTRHWTGVLLHAAIHGLVTAILLQNPLIHWPMLVTLWVIHFTIDWLKLQVDFKLQTPGFILDQIVHALVLLLLARWPSEITGTLRPTLLYPAVAYALIPALLTFLATLSIDLENSATNPTGWSKNKAPQLILLAQLVGYPLVIGILIVRFGG